MRPLMKSVHFSPHLDYRMFLQAPGKDTWYVIGNCLAFISTLTVYLSESALQKGSAHSGDVSHIVIVNSVILVNICCGQKRVLAQGVATEVCISRVLSCLNQY